MTAILATNRSALEGTPITATSAMTCNSSSYISTPLDFLANIANEQHKTLISKTIVTKADLAVSPALYLKALFMRHCPHVPLPLRPTLGDLVPPDNVYDMDVSRAIRTSNLEQVRSLYYEQGKSFDACNRFGETLIHMACRRGNVDIVNFLIRQAQVRVDVRDDFGRSVCHDACWTSSPNFDVMDALFKVVPPEYWVSEDKRGHTAFDYVRREHWGVWLKYLRAKEDEIVQKFALV